MDGARGRAPYIWKVSGLMREATGPGQLKVHVCFQPQLCKLPPLGSAGLMSSSLKDSGPFVRFHPNPPCQSHWPATGPRPQTAVGQHLSEAAFILPREGKYRNLEVHVCSSSTRHHPSPSPETSVSRLTCTQPLGCCLRVADSAEHIRLYPWGLGPLVLHGCCLGDPFPVDGVWEGDGNTAECVCVCVCVCVCMCVHGPHSCLRGGDRLDATCRQPVS